MLTFLLWYNLQNFNKMNEKRSLEYQNIGPEYVPGQINSRILEISFVTILQFDFCSI